MQLQLTNGSTGAGGSEMASLTCAVLGAGSSLAHMSPGLPGFFHMVIAF